MPPKKIKGRYEVRSVLGEGGMGVVYRAYDPPPMDREVAIKTLLEFPDRMSLQLFYKECEVLKSMSHPNIVEIFDIGEFDDGGTKKPFFVMPLLPGQALDVLIKASSHRLTVERVVDIISPDANEMVVEPVAPFGPRPTTVYDPSSRDNLLVPVNWRIA